MNIAKIYIENDYLVFTYKDVSFKFKSPFGLTKIEKIKSWNNGCLIVEAWYSYEETIVEDKINIKKVMKDKNINTDILNEINSVKLMQRTNL